MKSIGMARKIDDLGRIVLPVEMRRQLGIREGDHVDIAVDGSRILLQKVEDHCIFCGGATDLRSFHEKQVCQSCIAELHGGAPPNRSA